MQEILMSGMSEGPTWILFYRTKSDEIFAQNDILMPHLARLRQWLSLMGEAIEGLLSLIMSP